MKRIYIAVAKKHQKGLLDLFNAMQLSAEDRSCKAQHHDADLMGVSGAWLPRICWKG